jgi:hypothetical protein
MTMRSRHSRTFRVPVFAAALAPALAMLAMLCASARALPADGPLSAAPDTSAAVPRPARPDSARADTVSAKDLPTKWTMDELKTILTKETGEKTVRGYKEPKNGRLAMLCALLVPGLGQMYNERPVKAAIAAGAETYYLSWILLNARYSTREKRLRSQFPVGSFQWNNHDFFVHEYHERSIDYIWWSGGIALITIIDAYVDAHLFDMRFKVKPAASGDRIGFEIALDY